jgi:hypothetical protein
MAISFPRTDILTQVNFADQTFQLVSRQELSRQANGQTIGKDFGSAIWTATYTTVPLPNDDAVAYEAALNSLDGVIEPFEAYDLRRIYPREYPTGSCNDGVLNSVNVNNKAISLSGLAAGQIVSAGDYLSFTYGSSRALQQVMESVTADGSGLTSEFEVRPHIRPGFTLSPSTAVTVKIPSGLFTLVPGSVSSKLSGSIYSSVSFQGVQFLS